MELETEIGDMESLKLGSFVASCVKSFFFFFQNKMGGTSGNALCSAN